MIKKMKSEHVQSVSQSQHNLEGIEGTTTMNTTIDELEVEGKPLPVCY